jgi:hypothetical protein
LPDDLTPYQRELAQALLDLGIPAGKAFQVAIEYGYLLFEAGLGARRQGGRPVRPPRLGNMALTNP